MKKDRLASFIDGIIATFMIALVLGLRIPKEPSWGAIWDLRDQIVAYVISYFQIGFLWMSLHGLWARIERINYRVMVWTILLLFVLSFLPGATHFLSRFYETRIAQYVYWATVMLVSLANIKLTRELAKANRDNKEFNMAVKQAKPMVMLDIGTKIVSLVFAMLFYPPLVLYGIIVSNGIIGVSYYRQYLKEQFAEEEAEVEAVEET